MLLLFLLLLHPCYPFGILFNQPITMLFLLWEIVNRKIQASSLIFFRFICFRQKYLKCIFDFFYIFGSELIAGQQASSHLIRKRTGCNEYVEDHLNVANKNFAKYLFDNRDGKRYLEDICSMKGWSDKNAILNFFLGTT